MKKRKPRGPHDRGPHDHLLQVSESYQIAERTDIVFSESRLVSVGITRQSEN